MDPIFGQLVRLPLRLNGHDLIITINITGHDETPERTVFLTALRRLLYQTRSKQPSPEPKLRKVCCGKKKLEKSCHWNNRDEALPKFSVLAASLLAHLEASAKPHPKIAPYASPKATPKPPPKKTRKAPNLLDWPPKVLAKIMQYVFPMDQVLIRERPGYLVWSDDHTQTRYWKQHLHEKTTYVAWDRVRITYHRPVPKLGIGVSFLRVSRRCRDLGMPYLYSNGLEFNPHPSTCIAFLHDHQRLEHKIKHITLRYDDHSSGNAWRRLFNILVHRREDLRSVTVRIDSKFWQKAPWRGLSSYPDVQDPIQGAADVLEWHGWEHNHSGKPPERNFLGTSRVCRSRMEERTCE